MALDRPAGVTRNTGQGHGQTIIDLRWYHDFLLHPAKKDKSPAITTAIDASSSPFHGHAVANSACGFSFEVRIKS